MIADAAVVVPTHRRPELLAEALDGIDALRPGPSEVVVVVDGPCPRTEAVLRGRDVTVLRTPGIGPAGARNAGWRATTAPVVAFLDDDCVPDPGWLGGLVAGLGDDSIGIVQGTTVPASPADPDDRTIHVTGETGLYETCNIAYRREALVVVGGFDEHFAERLSRDGRWFAEDTDLAWRVRRTGWATTFRTDARVRHHVFPGTLRSSIREEWRRSLFPALIRAIPELAERTPAPHRLRPHSLEAQAALAGTALAALRRSPWPALAAAPYLRWALARHRRPGALARQVALDAVGSVALLVGSARHRRLLL
ncbi:glycosyltransferase [Acidimicrobiia bacterium EGI L10123]|uniref:glycosyltransferase family 2 protein n=1 Tax=Salinilacustrithrix flava TaxID=2957203 RepID=UPI003D7C346B|nr:glycosyltransferase [Acidimicrobiia bacterium EGI L10123]